LKGLADLARLDANALLQALAARRIGASELLEASMARAKATEGLNCIVARDPARVRTAAKRIDERRANAEPAEAMGLLGGLPLVVSDTLDVDGMAATAGEKRYKDRPVGDGVAVGHARSEGALPWAKGNTAEGALGWRTVNRLYGATRNPYDQTRGAGGASGGVAVALASGAAALGVGSDLDGGLLIPAGLCGVFAHRPTYGIVSHRGHVPPAPGQVAEPDLAVIGPMARSARDLRLLLSVISAAPVPHKAPSAVLAGMKVGLWLDSYPLDPASRAVIESFAEALKSLNVEVVALDKPVDSFAVVDTFATLVESLRGAAHPPSALEIDGARIARWFGAGPLSPAAMTLKRTITHRQWLEAHERRARLGQTVRRLLDRYEVLIAPVAPHPAFIEDRKHKLEARFGDWIALASACGLPATAIPIGRTPEGLPVGVQLIGPRGGDSRTLAVAQAIDEQLVGFVPPPLD
jgi:amidase